MKLSYYAYCLKNTETNERVKFNLNPLLLAFTNFGNITFKSQFTHNGENLYLLHNVGDTFLFLMTRSQEIIKKIDTTNISISELHLLLKNNEQLGFASYVLFRDSLFGFASTLLAPRCDAFVDYINQLLEKVNAGPWEFVPQVLLHQATKADVLSMSHLGRTTIELSKQNSLVENFLTQLSVNVGDTIDLDGIEITIKPIARKNIKPVIDKLIQNLPNEGVEKMVVKAKNEVLPQLQELFLISSGAITDTIDKSKEERIPELLQSKCEQNKYVEEKLKEYLEDEYLGQKSIDVIERFNSVDAWSERFPSV